jgi:Kef-type K+ transport system membrane component KefB
MDGAYQENPFKSALLDNSNPLVNGLSLFLLQVLIIFITTRCLSYLCRYINQPPVIAEVIGGLLLGPTGLSRIEVFKDVVFPDESLPRLKLIADLGLIMFLFLVGMELDIFKILGDL